MPRKYVDGFLCRKEVLIRSCSGCFEFNEGIGLGDWARDERNNIYLGSGCEECGFTGKRRESMWVPVKEDDHLPFFMKQHGCGHYGPTTSEGEHDR
jgi:hypothetical protein